VAERGDASDVHHALAARERARDRLGVEQLAPDHLGAERCEGRHVARRARVDAQVVTATRELVRVRLPDEPGRAGEEDLHHAAGAQ
jgi:hypothetical protein